MGSEGSVAVADLVALPDPDLTQALESDVVAFLAKLAGWTTLAAVHLARVNAARAGPDAERPLDAAALAAELGVAEKTAANLMAAGALPVERIGRRRHVRLADARAYRAAHRDAARPFPIGLASGYSPGHDKHRPAAPEAPAGPDPARTRGRARRPHDDRLPVGDRDQPDPAPRRHRPHAVRRSRGGGEPVDVGAADAFPARPGS
jgi:hypothetical protein